jgi:hypothetical protein
MFRRFGIKAADGSIVEMLLNLYGIKQIYVNSAKETIIEHYSTLYISAVEYRHLAEALDGVSF